MDEEQLHLLERRKAVIAGTLCAFGLGADCVMLAGGPLIWCGLVSALWLSGFVVWLYAAVLPDSILRGEPKRTSLIIPASMLAIVLICGFFIFKQQLLDKVYLKDIVSGILLPPWKLSVDLVLNPETWFLIILLSGFYVAQTSARKIPLAPPLAHGPDAEGVDQAPPRPSLFDKWAHTDPLSLTQAACLWNEELPISDARRLRGHAQARYIMLAQALRGGKMSSEKVLKGERSSDARAGPNTQIPRAELTKFADLIGEKPRFLFSDDMAMTSVPIQVDRTKIEDHSYASYAPDVSITVLAIWITERSEWGRGRSLKPDSDEVRIDVLDKLALAHISGWARREPGTPVVRLRSTVWRAATIDMTDATVGLPDFGLTYHDLQFSSTMAQGVWPA